MNYNIVCLDDIYIVLLCLCKPHVRCDKYLLK